MSSRPDPRLPETPLRTWRKSSGRSYAWLAIAAGCSLRTVMRVAAGRPAVPRVALALGRVTGLPATVFTAVHVAQAAEARVERLSKLDRLLEHVAKIEQVRDAILGEVAKEVG